MPVPFVPIAVVVAKYGGVAAVAYGLAKNIQIGRTDHQTEEAFDELPDGISVNRPRDRKQTNAGFRFRRVFRISPNKRGIELDVTALTRIRIRRVAP